MTAPAVAFEGCDRCRDRTVGWLYDTNEQGTESLRRCSCWTQRFEAVGVPAEFRSATLETWRETRESAHALKTARAFLKADPPRDLYLVGPVGTGKTRLACTLLNAWSKRGRTARFEHVPHLLLRLQPSSIDDEGELFHHCETASLLVLDDIGAEREKASDFTRRTLLTLYESRSTAGLVTIWTSNKTPAEVGQAMDDPRLMSRLTGRCQVVGMNGKDWRLRGGA